MNQAFAEGVHRHAAIAPSNPMGRSDGMKAPPRRVKSPNAIQTLLNTSVAVRAQLRPRRSLTARMPTRVSAAAGISSVQRLMSSIVVASVPLTGPSAMRKSRAIVTPPRMQGTARKCSHMSACAVMTERGADCTASAEIGVGSGVMGVGAMGFRSRD